MPEESLKEQLWKIYEKLPEELKEAIFSVEVAESIDDICQRNKVADEKVPEVAKYTGRVLMGLLPPDKFENTLSKEVKLGKDIAKNVAREINRFVFFPVKEVLSRLYDIEIAPPAKPKEAVELEEKASKADPEDKEERTGETDTYRETVE